MKFLNGASRKACNRCPVTRISYCVCSVENVDCHSEAKPKNLASEEKILRYAPFRMTISEISFPLAKSSPGCNISLCRNYSIR